jgi:hypothetical protein
MAHVTKVAVLVEIIDSPISGGESFWYVFDFALAIASEGH